MNQTNAHESQPNRAEEVLETVKENTTANVENTESTSTESVDSGVSDMAETDNNDATSQEPTVESLSEQVEALQKEVSDTKARANADMYNFQKRIERETSNAKKFALEKFAKDLLENIDNLERALDAAKAAGVAEDDALLQGVSLTHKAMMTTLEKHKVTVIQPANGDDFNADLHEAVGMDPEAEAGKVGKLLQKGYQLQDRLLRPAMVMVGQ